MSEIYEMNIDEIEKYIIGKKIKDMSLEEIRNFIETQGNTIILNHHIYEKQQLEIERLNNIINDFEEELERESNMKEEDTCLEHNTFIDVRNTLKTVLKRLQELKGSEKE